MLSLTVDRSRFASAEEAHRFVTEGGFIARLMRLLGVSTWFWVLEFQTATGEGWPHWHVLVDLSAVNGWLDYGRLWRLWRDKWRIGGLDVSKSRRSFAGASHAVFYVTKYMTKAPPAFPVWVLQRERVIRFVGGCKDLGSLTGQPSRHRQESEPDEQLKLFREPRTALLVRMAGCEMSATVFCVDGDCLTGDGSWSWMGTVPATPDDLVELAEQGLISFRVASVDWGDRELWAVTNKSIGGVLSALHKVRDELADREVGYAQAWQEAIDRRRTSILQHHQQFWLGRAA